MRKTFLLSIFLVIFLTTGAWGATYYASPTGSNTSPYDTWAKAANEPSSAITAGNGTAGPHTLYIAPGAYVNALAITNANWNSGTIQGTNAHGSTTAATAGQVTVTNTGNTLRIAQNSVTVNNITVQGATGSNASFYYDGGSGASGATLNQVSIQNTTGGYSTKIGSGSVTLNRCNLLNTTAAGAGLYVSGTGAVTANYCQILHSPTAFCTNGVNHTSSGTTVLNNSLITGLVIPLTCTAGTLTVNNCVVLSGDNSVSTSYVAKQSGTGTLNIDHSILIAGLYNVATFFSGTVGDTNNLKNVNVGYVRRQRSGIIILSTDDASAYPSGTWFTDLAAELNSRGLKATWYFNIGDATAPEKAGAQAWLAAGMEVGLHSRTHSELTLTTAWTVTKASSTINVDRGADTITIDAGGTVTGFKAKTLTTIRSELAALGVTNGAYIGTLSGNARGEILADTGGAQSCNTAYTLQLLIDTTAATGYFKEEFVDGKSELETLLGTTVYSVATPFGSSHANIATAAQNAGFLSSRILHTATGHNWNLASINVFYLSYWEVGTLIGATDDDTRALIRAACESVAQNGAIMFILLHSTEATVAQWGVILDTIAEYPEISVTSAKGAMDLITAGWSTADNITYTKTWTDQSNYHLKIDSLAVYGGTSVSLTSDYDGLPVPIPGAPGPSIGAYVP